jgi:hypothetical protein
MSLVYSEGQGGRRRAAYRRFERGDGKLRALVFTAVLALGIYSAVKIMPPYMANYQLSDKIQELARFSVVNHYTEDQVRDNVFKVIQDLEIPVKREEIKVTASNTIVKISLDYTVPVDLFFYHLDLHFTPASENKSLY